MATADTEASTEWGWLRRTWEKIGTVLAVLGLVDVSGQLIKWAEEIHWIVTKYAIAKAWLFGWLPWHIPPEWHDAIILFLILFSVTNVGLYRKLVILSLIILARTASWLRVSLPGQFFL